MATPDALLSACGAEVRRHDNDRFLTSLFAPADRREALFGLYAFNIEIAKTREVVTEPMLGRIRLQWWRESIDELYAGTVRRHEVLTCLAPAVESRGLSREHFDTLIDGREIDLDDEAPESLADLVAYAERTSVPLVLLGLEGLGVRDAKAAEAGRHVGIAWSLAGLLRAVPFHARSRRLYLPRDVLARHGVAPSRLFELKPLPGLPGAVAEVADIARQHVRQARALRPRVPRAALPMLLQGTLADSHLRVLARAGYDPFDARVQIGPPLRHLRLAARALTGRY